MYIVYITDMGSPPNNGVDQWWIFLLLTQATLSTHGGSGVETLFGQIKHNRRDSDGTQLRNSESYVAYSEVSAWQKIKR